MTRDDLLDTIARAIHDGPVAQEQYRRAGIAPHPARACEHFEQYRGDARVALDAIYAEPDGLALVAAAERAAPDRIKDAVDQLDGIALVADEVADLLHQAKHSTDDVDAAETYALAAERAGQAWVHAKAAARALKEIKP